jgi:hypothetical protein
MKIIGLSMAAMALAFPAPAQAPAAGETPQGRLMVHPTRLVLDDAIPRSKADRQGFLQNRGRSGEILLVNGGQERGTYRISMVNMDMAEDGSVHDVPRQPGRINAEDLIRYAPKQVTLEPHSTQAVRIQVRLPEGLAPGEYRSHMVFRAVPNAAPPRAPEAGAEAKGFSVKLTPIYGLSIPIIIRHGATQVSTDLTGLQLLPPAGPEGPPVFQFRINRKGNKSVFGDLEILWSPRVGLSRVVASRNGIAIYAKLSHRDFALDLPELPAKGRGPGTLKLRYLDHESKVVLAEAALDLPGTPSS